MANISEINYKTFFDCIHLKEVIMPETVTQIGEGAFYRCQSLESIKHYQQIDTIYEDSFDSCDSLSNDVVNYFSLVVKLPANNDKE